MRGIKGLIMARTDMEYKAYIHHVMENNPSLGMRETNFKRVRLMKDIYGFKDIWLISLNDKSIDPTIKNYAESHDISILHKEFKS